MKHIAPFLFLLILLFAVPVFASKGYVALTIKSCDYFAVKTTNDDYVLMEWSTGHEPEKGDILVGKFEQYGFTDIYCQTHDETSSLYIEDYWMSRDDVLEQ